MLLILKITEKKYIGNIFQSFNLVNSYTVYQNIELILRINGYSRSEMADRIPKIIEKVGLTPYTRTKVSKLSGRTEAESIHSESSGKGYGYNSSR